MTADDQSEVAQIVALLDRIGRDIDGLDARLDGLTRPCTDRDRRPTPRTRSGRFVAATVARASPL